MSNENNLTERRPKRKLRVRKRALFIDPSNYNPITIRIEYDTSMNGESIVLFHQSKNYESVTHSIVYHVFTQTEVYPYQNGPISIDRLILLQESTSPSVIIPKVVAPPLPREAPVDLDNLEGLYYISYDETERTEDKDGLVAIRNLITNEALSETEEGETEYPISTIKFLQNGIPSLLTDTIEYEHCAVYNPNGKVFFAVTKEPDLVAGESIIDELEFLNLKDTTDLFFALDLSNINTSVTIEVSKVEVGGKDKFVFTQL